MHFRASRIVFAVMMIAMGIVGLAKSGFAPIWAGVPQSLPDRQLLAYLCALVSLAGGVALLVKRTAATAAAILLLYLAAWTIAFKVPFIVRAPLVEGGYQSTGENLVFVAAAWVLYAELGKRFLAGALGLRIAYFLYGLALIAFGFSHFAYLELTAPLVPAWLGMPVFWAYLSGCIYLLAGVLLVTGIGIRLGAALAALEITLITVLVWTPIVAAGNLSPMHWQETIMSLALTAGAWVIAASVQARPWLELPWSAAAGRRAAAV